MAEKILQIHSVDQGAAVDGFRYGRHDRRQADQCVSLGGAVAAIHRDHHALVDDEADDEEGQKDTQNPKREQHGVPYLVAGCSTQHFFHHPIKAAMGRHGLPHPIKVTMGGLPLQFLNGPTLHTNRIFTCFCTVPAIARNIIFAKDLHHFISQYRRSARRDFGACAQVGARAPGIGRERAGGTLLYLASL